MRKNLNVTFSAFEKGAESIDSEINVRTISITMNDTNTQAEVLIFDSNQNIIYKKELLVKPAENDINDFNLYMKEQRKKKKKDHNIRGSNNSIEGLHTSYS